MKTISFVAGLFLALSAVGTSQSAQAAPLTAFAAIPFAAEVSVDKKAPALIREASFRGNASPRNFSHRRIGSHRFGHRRFSDGGFGLGRFFGNGFKNRGFRNRGFRNRGIRHRGFGNRGFRSKGFGRRH